MRPTPLDLQTRERVLKAIADAKFIGTDFVDTLQRRGLLLSPQVIAVLRAEAMEFLVHEARRWTPAEFLRRKNRSLDNASPTEMYHAIIEWLEEHAQAARSGQ